MMKFVFPDQDITRDFINVEEILSPLRKLGEITYFDDEPCAQDVIYERAKDADVIIFSINQLTNDLIARFTNLKIVQFMGIGYKNYVDEDFCRSRGIKAFGVGEYGSNAVAEYAIALMFSLMRGITVGDSRMKKKDWDMKGLLGREIAGSTVGIFGTGAIGHLVAQKAAVLGAKVIATDLVENKELCEKYGVKYVSAEELMENADIVSIHLKFTKSTEKFISSDLLSRMKPRAFFVNTARAQVVDYEALRKILEAGKISGAAIDVHYGEPPVDWSLETLPNVLATPHIGYFTEVANTNLLRKSVESVLKNL